MYGSDPHYYFWHLHMFDREPSLDDMYERDMESRWLEAKYHEELECEYESYIVEQLRDNMSDYLEAGGVFPPEITENLNGILEKPA